MSNLSIHRSSLQNTLRTLIYIFVLCAVIIYLFNQGLAPWTILLNHQDALLRIALCATLGICIQAISFKLVSHGETRSISNLKLINIWAFSALVSVVAPLFSGMATRSVLLLKEKIPLNTILASTGRQVWLGLEFSILFGAAGLALLSEQNISVLALPFFLCHLIMVGIRFISCSKNTAHNIQKIKFLAPFLLPLTRRIEPNSYPWFALQLITMIAIYFIAFNELGGRISIPEAIVLSSITVLASVLVFVPNGLGITDALWIYLASTNGASGEASTAIAISIRLAHLISSGGLFLLSSSLSSQHNNHLTNDR